MTDLINTDDHTTEKVNDDGTSAPASEPNTTTKSALLIRAKGAIESGEDSLYEAAEALGLAKEEHGASQREMAEAVDRSASWVNKLLKWRRSGYKLHSPFGPTTKRGRVEHAQQSKASKSQPSMKAGDPAAMQMLDAAKPGGGVNAKDEALFGFTEVVLELNRRTKGTKPERFAATSVSPDDLARLGKYLSDLSDLISSRRSKIARPKVSALLDAANDMGGLT